SRFQTTLSHLVLAAALAFLPTMASAQELSGRIQRLTAATKWTRVGEARPNFDTFHPQGFARIGEDIFVSSVEVIDRANAQGRAHLFRMQRDGTLLDRTDLTDGPRYHPGGIDY